MTDATRTIVDYALNDDAIKFREALYASIHDKVTAHLDAAKEIVAQNIVTGTEIEPEEQIETDENN
jgi:hypothetical protein